MYQKVQGWILLLQVISYHASIWLTFIVINADKMKRTKAQWTQVIMIIVLYGEASLTRSCDFQG